MPYDFKREEEVKEFLENIGIEYRFSCFKEKKPEGCQLLGDYLEAVKQDFPNAAKVYRMNCDQHNHGKSCYKFGAYAFEGKGCPEDKELSFRYQVKSCELGCMDGCFVEGLHYTSTQKTGVEPDPVKGLERLIKACELGSHNGCYFASGLLLTGKGALQKDMKRSFEFSKKACDLGNVYACSNLSLMYRTGQGVNKDEKLATYYKNKVLEFKDAVSNKTRTLEMEQGID